LTLTPLLARLRVFHPVLFEEVTMSQNIVQINFNYDVSADDYRGAASQLAPAFAAVTGLLWKVWIINEAEDSAGGIYLFEDKQSTSQFLESDLAAQVTNHPALRDFSVKVFDVMPEQSAITRAPLG